MQLKDAQTARFSCHLQPDSQKKFLIWARPSFFYIESNRLVFLALDEEAFWM